jgi:hypothetical protein
MSRRTGVFVLGALGAAAVILIVLELSLGAISFGRTDIPDPCTSKPSFEGGGLDGEVQRFALSGLYGAACELGTTPEELVLSFVPSAETDRVEWDRPTIEKALAAGFDRAYDDVEDRGPLGLVIGRILRIIVGAPIEFFLGRVLDEGG